MLSPIMLENKFIILYYICQEQFSVLRKNLFKAIEGDKGGIVRVSRVEMSLF
jgi:hypothetical protein